MITNTILTNLGSGGSSEITLPLNANQIGDGSVSNTEFGYLAGVEAGIQAQLDGCAKIGGTLTSGYLPIADSNGDLVNSIATATSTHFVPGRISFTSIAFSGNGTAQIVGANSRMMFNSASSLPEGFSWTYNAGTNTVMRLTNTILLGIGIGFSDAPGARVHSRSTADQFLADYDGTNKTRLFTDVNGYFNIVPSADRVRLGNGTTYLEIYPGVVNSNSGQYYLRLGGSNRIGVINTGVWLYVGSHIALKAEAAGICFNNSATPRYPTILADVTDGSGGTASTTIATISDSATADAIATLAAQIQSIKDALAGTSGVNLVSIAS